MSQMINCTFSEFHSHMFAESLIKFDKKTKFYLKDVVVENI